MQKYSQNRLRLNHQIRAPQVQVIDADGKQLGVMPAHEALRLAGDKGLDLVEVGPSAKPPVVRILDYGKYLYQKEKKERGQKSSSHSAAQEVKTVKIGFRTGEHDLQIKADQAVKFLQKGYRVRTELTLRGREKSMADAGRKKLDSFTKLIAHPYEFEDQIKRFPGGWGVLIKPSKGSK